MTKILTAIAHVHTFPLTVQRYYFKTRTWMEHVKQAYHYYKVVRAEYRNRVREEEKINGA